MRRVTACFGGECKLNDIGRETNTLISDMTTVICLDDFHSNDRNGRKKSGAPPSARFVSFLVTSFFFCLLSLSGCVMP